MHRKHILLISLLCLIFSISGCTYPISKSIRKEIDPQVTFDQLRKDPDAFIGKVVLLGGEIIKIQNEQEGTLMEVLQRRLDAWSRPREEDKTEGRFLVLSSEFLDPAVYKEGRKITVAGEVTGKRIQKLGNIDYMYPLLRTREMHLWTEYPEIIYSPYPVWYYWDIYHFSYHPWYLYRKSFLF